MNTQKLIEAVKGIIETQEQEHPASWPVETIGAALEAAENQAIVWGVRWGLKELLIKMGVSEIEAEQVTGVYDHEGVTV
jgi:hypothetical protein